MPTIVVVGHGGDRNQSLRCRRLESFCVVPAPLHLQGGNKYRYVADMENVQEVFPAVPSTGLHDLVGVIGVHDSGVYAATYLRRQLNPSGNFDSQGVLFFRDKYLKKSRLPPDVRRARARYASRVTPYAELAEELRKPFVVEPAIGAGPLRTEAVRSAEDYHRALEPFPGESDVDVVAKSFVDAPEIYMDGVRQGGELHWRSLTRHGGPPAGALPRLSRVAAPRPRQPDARGLRAHLHVRQAHSFLLAGHATRPTAASAGRSAPTRKSGG